MKIEPNIIDENIEKKGLYSDTTINTLQERLDTINFQLDSVNMQLDESVVSIGVDEKARLLAEKSRLEEEKIDIEYKIAELKEEKEEESELESADAFEGSLDKKGLTDVQEGFRNYGDDTSYGLIIKDVELHSTIKPLYTAREIGKASVPVANMEKKQEERKVENETVHNEIRSRLGARPKSSDDIEK